MKTLNVEKIRKDFKILNSSKDGKRLVYFDNAATAQKPKIVIDAVKSFYETANANIHRGVYQLSENATTAYEESRAVVGDFINASPDEIVFTKNATESLNLLAYSLCSKFEEGDEILLTQMEHHSNIVPWQQIAKNNKLKLRFAEINSDGTLNADSFKKLLNRRTKIVSVAHVSNFLGTINSVKELAVLAHSIGALFVVDGAQSVPHFSVDVRDLNCDFLVFSSHKLCGPTGVGVLYGKKVLLEKMSPFLYGGDMIREVCFDDSRWNDVPWKFEAGTPDICGVIGLAKAIEYLKKTGMDKIADHEKELTVYAMQELAKIEGLTLYGPSAENRAGIISFNINGVHAHDVASFLDGFNIAVRAGNHCAMPLAKILGVSGTARISFYFYNTKKEIDFVVKILKQARGFFAK